MNILSTWLGTTSSPTLLKWGVAEVLHLWKSLIYIGVFFDPCAGGNPSSHMPQDQIPQRVSWRYFFTAYLLTLKIMK